MKLEGIKVGDKVWIGGFKHSPKGTFTPNPWYYRIVESVSAKQFRIGQYRYWIESGKSASGDVATVLSIATPQELAEWDAKIKQAREEKEAAEQAQQQARQDALRRLSGLLDALATGRMPITMVSTVALSGATITFQYADRKFRIEEVDAD